MTRRTMIKATLSAMAGAAVPVPSGRWIVAGCYSGKTFPMDTEHAMNAYRYYLSGRRLGKSTMSVYEISRWLEGSLGGSPSRRRS